MVLGHVVVVDEGDVIELGDLLGLVVAGEAAVLLHLAGAAQHVAVAVGAGDAALQHERPVVVGHVAQLEVLGGQVVAAGAAADGVDVAPLALAQEVAQDAGVVGHLDVPAHHHLRVARHAPQLAPPAPLGQVGAVIEVDPGAGDDPALQQPGGVAAGAHAGGVVHLGVGLGGVGAGHVLDHLREGLELVPQVHLRGAGGVVALHARDLVVLGGLPGLVVGLHDVARVAEGGAFRVAHQPAQGHQRDGHPHQHEEPEREADPAGRLGVRPDSQHGQQRTPPRARGGLGHGRAPRVRVCRGRRCYGPSGGPDGTRIMQARCHEHARSDVGAGGRPAGVGRAGGRRRSDLGPSGRALWAATTRITGRAWFARGRSPDFLPSFCPFFRVFRGGGSLATEGGVA